MALGTGQGVSAWCCMGGGLALVLRVCRGVGEGGSVGVGKPLAHSAVYFRRLHRGGPSTHGHPVT